MNSSLPHRKGWIITPEPRTGWHPKITPYRVILTLVTIALGTAKALSPSAIGSVTIEWIGGLGFFLVVFFLSYLDGNETARPKWLFQTDLMDPLRDACLKAGIVIPIYDTTDKFEARSFGWKKRPSITGYRLLVSAIALSFGTTKAYLSYTGNEAGSKGVEWAYGSIFSLLLYWLSLYESGPREIVPWLFEEDYDLFLFCWSLALLNGIAATLMTNFFEPLLNAVSTTYRKGGWHFLEALGLVAIGLLVGAMCAGAFCGSLHTFWIPLEEPMRPLSGRLKRIWRRYATTGGGVLERGV